MLLRSRAEGARVFDELKRFQDPNGRDQLVLGTQTFSNLGFQNWSFARPTPRGSDSLDAKLELGNAEKEEVELR